MLENLEMQDSQKLTITIDPPGGWRYGFPMPVLVSIVQNPSLLSLWLLAQGYPGEMLELAMKHSRYIGSEDAMVAMAFGNDRE